MLTLLNWTVFGVLTGFSQTDSIKCFNIEQQKAILKKFVQLDGCLELRKADSVYISSLETTIDTTTSKLKTAYKNLAFKEEEVIFLNEKIDRKNTALRIGLPASGIVGFIVGLMLK